MQQSLNVQLGQHSCANTCAPGQHGYYLSSAIAAVPAHIAPPRSHHISKPRVLGAWARAGEHVRLSPPPARHPSHKALAPTTGTRALPMRVAGDTRSPSAGDVCCPRRPRRGPHNSLTHARPNTHARLCAQACQCVRVRARTHVCNAQSARPQCATMAGGGARHATV